MPETSVARRFRSIQGLRAIAALSVVVFHTTVLWRDMFDPGATLWSNGNAGVDLFFVISGFVMTVSSRRLLALADGWRRFILLRLVRVVPMYWLVTTVKLVALASIPVLASHARVTNWNVVASFLFIPSRDAAGLVRPVIDVGWTLEFEMLFYLMFAVGMLVARDPSVVVASGLAALAFASPSSRANWPAVMTFADPIVLEFAFGIALARLLAGRLRRQVPLGMSLVLAVVGLGSLAFLQTNTPWERCLIWGLSATSALCGTVLSERWLGRYVPRLLVEVGDASYSLYLTHGFVLPLVGLALLKSRLTITGHVLEFVLILTASTASIVVGLAVYRFVELPITRWLRNVANARRGAIQAPVESAG